MMTRHNTTSLNVRDHSGIALAAKPAAKIAAALPKAAGRQARARGPCVRVQVSVSTAVLGASMATLGEPDPAA
jgi:hypothetical protein